MQNVISLESARKERDGEAGPNDTFMAHFVCAWCSYLFLGFAPRSLDERLRAALEGLEEGQMLVSPFKCPHCGEQGAQPVWKDLDGFAIVRFDGSGTPERL